MRKIREIWENITPNDKFVERAGKTILWFFAILFAVALLSFIPFFTPITDPILNAGRYVVWGVLGIYIFVVCCLILMQTFVLIKEYFFTSREKMRTGVAWVIGGLVSLLLMCSLFILLNMLGIELEEDDNIWGVWGASFIFSVMIGARCGMAICNEEISDNGKIQFKAWLIGVFAFGGFSSILEILLDQAWDMSWLVNGLLKIALVIILFFVLYTWQSIKIENLSDERKDK